MARVLVVEDQLSLRRLLGTALMSAGHDVVVAGDGREAINQLESGTFDALILDLMMPGLDGFAVLEAVGDDRPPTLVVSARDDAVAIGRALDLGVGGYVTKPYDPDEVVARVAALLT